jgi:hypothetical protein
VERRLDCLLYSEVDLAGLTSGEQDWDYRIQQSPYQDQHVLPQHKAIRSSGVKIWAMHANSSASRYTHIYPYDKSRVAIDCSVYLESNGSRFMYPSRCQMNLGPGLQGMDTLLFLETR